VRIVPFRGEYYQLSQQARGLVRNLVYPVPNPAFPFLGIHFTRGVDGSVECGPNAVLNLGRETYKKAQLDPTDLAETLLFPGFLRLLAKYHHIGAREMLRSLSKKAFVEAAQALVPRLEARHLIPAPAGIRAQAVSPSGVLVDDFLLAESEYVLSVVNAPSPAATASLQIGHHIALRVESALRHRISL
jgi:L-2-hydroxyglutarate oxidase